MSFKSIRWKLVFWYVVIIFGSLTLLGWALYSEMRSNLYEDAESRLEYWMSTVQRKLADSTGAEFGTEILEALPPEALFCVSDIAGRTLAKSAGFSSNGIAQAWAKARSEVGSEYPTTVVWKHMRGAGRRSASGQAVFVAINARIQHHRIRAFLTVLLWAGAAIMLAAALGGWWIVGRALSPIQEIAKTAERISVENLSERIETQDIQNELGTLASTLNASFDRLEASFERQARFTADASHELRTPLTIIMSHLELARQEGRSLSDIQERLGICDEASQRMRCVVEGLLTLARADAGEIRLEQGPVSLSKLLTEVRDSLEALAEARDITFSLELESVTIKGDPSRLREVIVNLYSNAITYSQPGGQVSVSLSQGNESAILKVKDTGRGISPADLPRIFDRFYRADTSRSFSERGAGLGLAISQEIIQLHGGSISAVSALGQGSVFSVRLPISS